jgi:hypothetical protein
MLYPIKEVLIADPFILLIVVSNLWECLRDDDGKWEEVEGEDILLRNDMAPASADTALARADSFAVLFE